MANAKQPKSERTKKNNLFTAIPEEISDKMEALRQRIQRRTPYNRLPMNHVVRRLLEAGLVVVSAEEDRIEQARNAR